MRVRPFSPIDHPDFNEVVVHFTGRRSTSEEASHRLLQVVEGGAILATIPYGIAFTKAFLFNNGGAPAIVVRGDEWRHVRNLPPELRARTIRLWPGATDDLGEVLPSHLETRSEWLGEREWRVPAENGTPAITFGTDDIAFLVVPDAGWVKSNVRNLVKAGGTEAGRRLASVRWIALSHAGEITANNGVKLSSQ